MKKILLTFILFVFCSSTLTGCYYNDEENTYKVELNKEPYNVCGEKIYFSNDSFGNELDIDSIIEAIKMACNVDNYELAKNEIEDILGDSDYTKEDIIYHLEDIYYYLDK